MVAMVAFTGCVGGRPSNGRKVTMEVTGYCPCGKCCGWQRNYLGIPVFSYGPDKGRRKRVGICADGTRAKRGTAAADTAHYPFGTRMYVPGYGWATVRDRGGAIKGPARLDLFFPRHRDALKWGRRKVTVTVYDE
jgi:3D (Asp-Asp-Asp) domain-containing protein